LIDHRAGMGEQLILLEVQDASIPALLKQT
jgi:hypothetical protein